LPNKVQDHQAVLPATPLPAIRVTPNPFSQQAVISVPAAGKAVLSITDTHGNLVQTLAATRPEITWNGLDKNGNEVSCGIYYAVLSTAENRTVAQIIKVK
jgi:flagellar hook assembly protein FlgD